MPTTETILNELESAAQASIKAASVVLEKCHKARKQLGGIHHSAARKGLDLAEMKMNRRKYLIKHSVE